MSISDWNWICSLGVKRRRSIGRMSREFLVWCVLSIEGLSRMRCMSFPLLIHLSKYTILTRFWRSKNRVCRSMWFRSLHSSLTGEQPWEQQCWYVYSPLVLFRGNTWFCCRICYESSLCKLSSSVKCGRWVSRRSWSHLYFSRYGLVLLNVFQALVNQLVINPTYKTRWLTDVAIV